MPLSSHLACATIRKNKACTRVFQTQKNGFSRVNALRWDAVSVFPASKIMGKKHATMRLCTSRVSEGANRGCSETD